MERTPEQRRRHDLLVMYGRRRRYLRERATIATRSTLLRASGHQART